MRVNVSRKGEHLQKFCSKQIITSTYVHLEVKIVEKLANFHIRSLPQAREFQTSIFFTSEISSVVEFQVLMKSCSEISEKNGMRSLFEGST